jgi:hypothetical protein
MNRLLAQLRTLLSDLDYAQRRSLELQTGIRFTRTPRRQA